MRMTTMKMKRIRNAIKDVPRNTANCNVLQENSETGSAHVKRTTPLATKRRELMADPQYQADAIDGRREKNTSRKRADKETKPV